MPQRSAATRPLNVPSVTSPPAGALNKMSHVKIWLFTCRICSTNECEFPHVKLVLWHSGAVVDILLCPEFDFLPGQNLSVRSLPVPFIFVMTPSRYKQGCTACWRLESFSVNKLTGQKSHLQSTSIKFRCLAAFSQNLAKSQCFWLIFSTRPPAAPLLLAAAIN